MRYLTLAVSLIMAWESVGVAQAGFLVTKRNSSSAQLMLGTALSRWYHVGTYAGGTAPKRWPGSAFVPSVWVHATHVFDTNALPEAVDTSKIASSDWIGFGDAKQGPASALSVGSASGGGAGGIDHGMAGMAYLLPAIPGGGGSQGGETHLGSDGTVVSSRDPEKDSHSQDLHPTVGLGRDDNEGAFLPPELARKQNEDHVKNHLQSVKKIKRRGQSSGSGSSSVASSGGSHSEDDLPPFPGGALPPASGHGDDGGVGAAGPGPTAQNPEPASITLLSIGGMAVAGSAWWKRNRRKPA